MSPRSPLARRRRSSERDPEPEESQSPAGILFILGLAAAIWSASGYVAAFTRASNAIYDVDEGRPIWKTLPLRVVLTLVLLILLAISAVAVVVTGGLAGKAGELLGLGEAAVTAWDIAKWPALLVLVSFMFALLYWAAPNVKQPGFRWISPAVSWPCSCGSSPPPRSPSTSPTSAPTTRPTARWAE